MLLMLVFVFYVQEGEEGEHEGSPEPEIVAAAALGEGERKAGDPEPTDLVSLLSSLRTPTGHCKSLLTQLSLVSSTMTRCDIPLTLLPGSSQCLEISHL